MPVIATVSLPPDGSATMIRACFVLVSSAASPCSVSTVLGCGGVTRTVFPVSAPYQSSSHHCPFGSSFRTAVSE